MDILYFQHRDELGMDVVAIEVSLCGLSFVSFVLSVFLFKGRIGAPKIVGQAPALGATESTTSLLESSHPGPDPSRSRPWHMEKEMKTSYCQSKAASNWIYKQIRSAFIKHTIKDPLRCPICGKALGRQQVTDMKTPEAFKFWAWKAQETLDTDIDNAREGREPPSDADVMETMWNIMLKGHHHAMRLSNGQTAGASVISGPS